MATLGIGNTLLILSADEFFSINLRKLRELRSLSQEELAARAKVGHQTIFRAESKGTIPQGKNITKIAVALHVPVSTLFEDPKGTKKVNKSDLVLAIISKLPTLHEDELRFLIAIIDKIPLIRGLDSNAVSHLLFDILKANQK